MQRKPVLEAPAAADGLGIQKSVDLSLGGIAPERILPGTGERGRCIGRAGELFRDRAGFAAALEHERHRGVAGVKLRLHRFENRSGRAAAQKERAVDRLDDRALARFIRAADDGASGMEGDRLLLVDPVVVDRDGDEPHARVSGALVGAVVQSACRMLMA